MVNRARLRKEEEKGEWKRSSEKGGKRVNRGVSNYRWEHKDKRERDNKIRLVICLYLIASCQIS